MTIKYTFFDLGDTLIDMSFSSKALYFGLKSVLPDKLVTEELVSKWEKESYKTFEHHYKKEEFYTIKRLQAMSLKIVLLEQGIDLVDHKLVYIVNKFWRYFIKNCQLYDDVLPTLSQLNQNDYGIGLITNGDEENVDSILKKYNLDNIFKIKVISGALKNYKPGLLLFERSLEIAKCLPQDAIYVGDSVIDIYGAKKIGMITVLINRTKTAQNNMLKIEPDFLIDNLYQLLKIIEKTES